MNRVRVPRKTKKVLKTFVQRPPVRGSRMHRRFLRFFPRATADLRQKYQVLLGTSDWLDRAFEAAEEAGIDPFEDMVVADDHSDPPVSGEGASG